MVHIAESYSQILTFRVICESNRTLRKLALFFQSQNVFTWIFHKYISNCHGQLAQWTCNDLGS